MWANEGAVCVSIDYSLQKGKRAHSAFRPSSQDSVVTYHQAALTEVRASDLLGSDNVRCDALRAKSSSNLAM